MHPGRDADSVDTTDRLIVGGIVALVVGPLLGAAAFYATGAQVASVAALSGIFPAALGIDAIRTGIKRRKARHEPAFRPRIPLSSP